MNDIHRPGHFDSADTLSDEAHSHGWRHFFTGRNLLRIAIVVAVILVLAWLVTPKGTKPPPGGRGGMGGPMPVVAAAAQTGDMPIVLNGLGAVTPIATVTVQTQINGQLTEVGFQEGQLVNKGDFLAQIDPRPYQVALEQAEGTLAKDQASLADARLGAVTSAQTERYRIERDLHDSVQPRLVSLAMTIGLVQTKLDTDPATAKALIAEAHEDAKTALVELRNVVRGIAPTILSDRGLDAALSSVVQRAAVQTTLDVDLPRRLPEETESVAYFVVAEALTNTAKHAQASRAAVTVRLL